MATAPPADRDELEAAVAALMAGSIEAARHTHIECHCPGLVHRKDEYETGCFCPGCASKEAVVRGLAASDTEREADGPDDSPQWCETCGRLITTEITADGAEEELAWRESTPPGTPDEWREFMLCVEAIDEERLPRVERVVAAGRAAVRAACLRPSACVSQIPGCSGASVPAWR